MEKQDVNSNAIVSDGTNSVVNYPTPAPSNDPSINNDPENPVFNKLLREKKNVTAKNQELMSEVEKLRQELKIREEKELEQQQNFQELAKRSKEDAESWKQKYLGQQKLIENAAKEGSLKSELRKLGIKENRIPLAMKMVDISAVKYDNETKTVFGHEEIAKSLSDTVPEFFGGSSQISQNAPTGVPVDFGLENYKNLSKEDRRKAKEKLFAQHGINRTK